MGRVAPTDFAARLPLGGGILIGLGAVMALFGRVAGISPPPSSSFPRC